MKKLFIPIIIIIALIFVIILFRSGKNTPSTETTTTTTTTQKTTKKSSGSSNTEPPATVNSTDQVFYQHVDPSVGAPYKTVVDPNNTPGVSIYWVRQGNFGGQDTCTLYDNATLQIYANRYLGSQTLGVPRGTVYYTNDVIKQDKAISLLNDICFI